MSTLPSTSSNWADNELNRVNDMHGGWDIPATGNGNAHQRAEAQIHGPCSPSSLVSETGNVLRGENDSSLGIASNSCTAWRSGLHGESNELPGSAAVPATMGQLCPIRVEERCTTVPRTLTQTNAESLVAYYTDAWTVHCLPALHPTFRHLTSPSGLGSVVTDSIVSLAACRLSRRLPQRKLIFSAKAPAMSFRPDGDHESLSYEHYGIVMHRLATWHPRNFDANPVFGLALLVMFCYLESSMGNFRNFHLHSKAIKVLVQNHSDTVLQCGLALLAAWIEVEAQSWWRRVYFSTPEFHQGKHSGSPQLLEPQLAAALHTSNTPRASILLILCESHRLNSTAVLVRWGQRHDEKLLESVDTCADHGPNTLERYTAQLECQSKMLDNWHASQSSTDLPISPVALCPQSSLGQPLRFRSHDAAMNFAYYATARVMQCIQPLQILGLASTAGLPSAYKEAEIWISLLLGIAAGIDWRECIRLNVYRVGFASLLLACALRSHNLAIGASMQTWLEERLQNTDFEEGNFPVFQVLGTLRLINRERSRGWDVISLHQIEDDGGGSGKLSSYHSQDLQSLVVYGRSRATGELRVYQRTL
ncbi:uncharacterized protein HMPREF1541_09551 [Cyphellophora europaea CBS 101466]|uniref:Transcription factor domain-containing protein n=1 Tax=Cyphellophora europaea (strain CBS 101466) TaxID=1220924 RepID=W2SCF2_CYPE1|nr:uncharacterized protein HMPREF1541_09551 [Cyphellophora europaea CBS 101466]ETN45718.1 hypothetical protein HMPREF1541_09551 [Cyphellophora europaea CBS 101466]